jgi:predicted ATPase
MAKKTKKRIILTGAHGTGKTTLMNELAKDGTRTLSIARDAATAGNYPPTNETREAYQKDLFAAGFKALNSKKNYISDRGLTCIAGYTFFNALAGTITKKTADNQYLKLQKFHKDNPDILVVYVPIEFELAEDGLRSVDPEEQAAIDFMIKNILDTAGIEYITVTGTVEERVAQIENALANR